MKVRAEVAIERSADAVSTHLGNYGLERQGDTSAELTTLDLAHREYRSRIREGMGRGSTSIWRVVELGSDASLLVAELNISVPGKWRFLPLFFRWCMQRTLQQTLDNLRVGLEQHPRSPGPPRRRPVRHRVRRKDATAPEVD